MDEQEIKDDLIAKGYDNVWTYDAEAGEVDDEHAHDYDTQLVILSGQIHITSFIGDKSETLSHSMGSHINILRNTPHAAKVGVNGCRYIVAEKH